MKKDAAEREAKLAEERDTYKGKYQGERIRNALATAIPKYTTAGTADLQELLQKKISVDPETDALVIEGEPVNPKTGKEYTIEEWVEAVNGHGGFGQWASDVCLKPADLPTVIAKAAR